MNNVLCMQWPREMPHTHIHRSVYLLYSLTKHIYSVPFLFEVCLLLRRFFWFLLLLLLLLLLLPVFIAAGIVRALRHLHSSHTHTHTAGHCATWLSGTDDDNIVKRVEKAYKIINYIIFCCTARHLTGAVTVPVTVWAKCICTIVVIVRNDLQVRRTVCELGFARFSKGKQSFKNAQSRLISFH